MTEAHALPPLVQELARAAELVDGRLRYTEQEQARWLLRIEQLDPAQRSGVARAIAALAAKFHRLGAGSAEPAIDVLLGFCVLLLGSEAAATAVLSQLADEVEAAASIGVERDKRPLSQRPAPAGAMNPLETRLKRG